MGLHSAWGIKQFWILLKCLLCVVSLWLVPAGRGNQSCTHSVTCISTWETLFWWFSVGLIVSRMPWKLGGFLFLCSFLSQFWQQRLIFSFSCCRIGPEPTTDAFTAVMYGENEQASLIMMMMMRLMYGENEQVCLIFPFFSLYAQVDPTSSILVIKTSWLIWSNYRWFLETLWLWTSPANSGRSPNSEEPSSTGAFGFWFLFPSDWKYSSDIYYTIVPETMSQSYSQVPVLDRKEPSVEVCDDDRHPGNPLRRETASWPRLRFRRRPPVVCWESGQVEYSSASLSTKYHPGLSWYSLKFLNPTQDCSPLWCQQVGYLGRVPEIHRSHPWIRGQSQNCVEQGWPGYKKTFKSTGK